MTDAELFNRVVFEVLMRVDRNADSVRSVAKLSATDQVLVPVIRTIHIPEVADLRALLRTACTDRSKELRYAAL